MPAIPVTTSSSWQVTRTLAPVPSHAIDATSRVVSFVLGFALASVFAWLGSLPSGDDGSEARASSAAPKVESVAPAVEPVVTAATVATPFTPAAVPATAPPAETVAPRIKAAAPRAPSTLPVAPPLQKKRARASGYRGALVLSSTPEGAQVLINGGAMGQTPMVLEDLPAGSRALVLRRDGYAPWSASVRIVADRRTMVRATLTAAARP